MNVGVVGSKPTLRVVIFLARNQGEAAAYRRHAPRGGDTVGVCGTFILWNVLGCDKALAFLGRIAFPRDGDAGNADLAAYKIAHCTRAYFPCLSF